MFLLLIYFSYNFLFYSCVLFLLQHIRTSFWWLVFYSSFVLLLTTHHSVVQYDFLWYFSLTKCLLIIWYVLVPFSFRFFTSSLLWNYWNLLPFLWFSHPVVSSWVSVCVLLFLWVIMTMLSLKAHSVIFTCRKEQILFWH